LLRRATYPHGVIAWERSYPRYGSAVLSAGKATPLTRRPFGPALPSVARGADRRGDRDGRDDRSRSNRRDGSEWSLAPVATTTVMDQDSSRQSKRNLAKEQP